MWVWDWFNMYEYDFYFGEGKINGCDVILLLIYQVDFGYYDV